MSNESTFGKYCARGIARTAVSTPMRPHIEATAFTIASSFTQRLFGVSIVMRNPDG